MVGSVTELIQIKEGHNLLRVLGLSTCLQQQPTVVEGKADHLLYLADDFTVAVPARTNTCTGHHTTQTGSQSMGWPFGEMWLLLLCML
jgi:hypothetical protein